MPLTLKRFTLAALLTFTALVALAGARAATAHAGQFHVYSCYDVNGTSNGWFKDYNNWTELAIYDNCAGEGLAVRSTNDNWMAGWLTYGAWVFNAPANTNIDSMTADIDIRNAGWDGGIYDGGNTPFICGPLGTCPAGGNNRGYLYFGGASQIKTQVTCPIGASFLGTNGCMSAGDTGHVYLHNIDIVLNDPYDPGLNSQGGSMWTDSWVRGNASASFNAWDPESGINRSVIQVDSADRAVATPYCDNYRLKPCDDGGASTTIDTNTLGDGMHSVHYYTVNQAGMAVDGGTHNFGVDNTSQGAPLGVTQTAEGTVTGSGWTNNNRFDASYGVPGSTAPITSGTYQLCHSDGTSCTTGSADTDGSTTIPVPGAGSWKARFSFNDAAGNGGAWSAWTSPMNYDPVVPGLADQPHVNGWMNQTEYRTYSVSLPSDQPFGLSGIAGYAIGLDGAAPGTTVDIPATNSSASSFAATQDLPLHEGTNTIKVRAISGAGVPSNLIRTDVINVDLTKPDADQTGAPAGSDTAGGSAWQPTAQTITFKGVDQPTLSGMAPKPSNEPDITKGAYTEYRVDGHAWEQASGDTAVLAGLDTGDHTIDYRAVDFAGNVGASQQLRVKVDTNVPGEARVKGTDGWISDTKFLEDIDLQAGTLGPSGLRGYAVTTNGQAPSRTNVDTAASGVYRMSDLPEGITTIKARAVTVAGNAATDPDVGTAEVKIDRTAPTVSIAGAPSGEVWQDKPVDLTFNAADQAGLSGVDRIEYQVDGGETKIIRGFDTGAGFRSASSRTALRSVDPDAGPQNAAEQIEVGSDGPHTVSYWAVDKAGNRSAPSSVTFRIDRTGPAGGMEPMDPNDPTKVSFFVSDSCIKSAQIQMRKRGTESWKDLDTQVQGNHVVAHIPDQAYAEGDYDVRAVVTDCAGNVSILDKWWGGQQAGDKVALNLPLRVKTTLKSAFAPDQLAKQCVATKKSKVTTKTKGKNKVRKTVKHYAVTVCPKVKPKAKAKHKPTSKKKKKNKAKTTAKHRSIVAFMAKAKNKPAKPKKQAKKAAPAKAKITPAKPKTIYGFLASEDGKPLTNVAVDVMAAVRGTNAYNKVASATTDAQGVVQATVPGGTPSRDVKLVYSGTPGLMASESDPLTIDVAASSTIKANHPKLRNGQTVKLSGALLGGYVPAKGRDVIVQGYNPVKKKWLPVAIVKTDAKGAWKTNYKFTATGGTVTYRFRLLINDVGGASYPFSTGYSPEAKVTVTGKMK